MRRVITYVDGFNLYNGLKAGYRYKYLWLDLQRLSEGLLQNDQELVAVRYFTAPVRNQPSALRRQQLYWNALRSHCDLVTIELGRFQEKTIDCRGCGDSRTSYEEKETDVAIAVSLVEDAAHRAFDTALVISADSDLCPAVRAVRRLHPTASVIAAFPPKRRSDKLRSVVTASFTIPRQKLQNAQLPNPTVASAGQRYNRPEKWR